MRRRGTSHEGSSPGVGSSTNQGNVGQTPDRNPSEGDGFFKKGRHSREKGRDKERQNREENYLAREKDFNLRAKMIKKDTLKIPMKEKRSAAD